MTRTMSGRGVLVAITAAVFGASACSSPGPSPSPAATTSAAATQAAPTQGKPGVAPPFGDITTYKGTMDRLGVHPGPGPASQPVVLWSIDLSSGAVAAPLVIDGTVIAISEDGSIRAVDGATGAAAWSASLPSGVSVTPTISNGTLYSVTVDGVLRTMSLADRSLGWTADGFLPDTQVTMAGDLVLAGAAGEIVAVNAADGTERWRAKADGSGRAAADAKHVYVSGTGSGDMHVFTLADGKPAWTLETDTATVLTPGVIDGRVIVAARGTAGGRNVVYALNPDGAEAWHSSGPDVLGSVSVMDGHVYVSVDEPKTAIFALDGANNSVLWRRELGGRIAGLLAAADGVLYLSTNEDGVVAVDASTGEVRWRADLEKPDRAQLAVTGGLVIAAPKWGDGSGRLLALADPSDPRIGATATPGPTATAAPVVAASVALRILSHDLVEGRTLMLATAVGPDGTMYAGDMLNSRIVVRSPAGKISMWGEYGSGPGQFNFTEVTRNDGAVGVAVAPDGKLIAVGDGGNHRVQLFDGARKHLLSIGRLGREDGQFVNPCCVAVDAKHRIWVVDTAREDVQVFSEAGEHLLTFAGPGHADGQLSRPAYPFLDEATRELYVPDFANRRVSVFSEEGTWLRHYSGDMGNGNRLGEVNAVAVDSAGRVYAMDTTSRVFVLEKDGKPIAVIDSTDPDLGFAESASFVLDAQGRMYYPEIRESGGAQLVIGQLEAPLWPPS